MTSETEANYPKINITVYQITQHLQLPNIRVYCTEINLYKVNSNKKREQLLNKSSRKNDKQ